MTRSMTLSESDLRPLVSARRDTRRPGILASFHAFMDRMIPFGFEDENGFHFGMEPLPPAAPGDQAEIS